jgi:excisionase family DNA binding protein
VAKRSLSKQIEDDLRNGTRDTWLDISQAAQRINKTPRFVRRLIAERRIKYYKHNSLIAILASDLDKWATSEPHEPLR